MKTRTVLLIALCALLPFLGQAVTTNVVCDLAGNKCDGGTGTTIGSITRDMFYMVTLDETQEMDYLHVGWLGGSATDLIAIDASGAALGWSSTVDFSVEPFTNYVDHGLITSPFANTPEVLVWQGSSISNGTYYFGYNTTQTLFATVGFLATGSAVLNEDWSQPVGQGVGPVHVPIPEPASVLMLGLGGVLIGLYRRFYSRV